MKIEIETYTDENSGKDMVIIGADNYSGARYEYNSPNELCRIVNSYIKYELQTEKARRANNIEREILD